MIKEQTKKQIEMKKKKEEIYTTSIQLFKEYGYENVSIKDICKATNTSTGSLYNIYKNKAAILIQFKEYLIKDCYENLEKACTRTDYKEVITEYIVSILQKFSDLGTSLTLVMHLSHDKIIPEKSYGSLGTKLLENYVEKLKEEKIITLSLNATQIVEIINMSIYGMIYYWCTNNSTFDLVMYGENYIPHILAFLK